ncbi:MAG TPA: tetratricopeptide repeat protein [Thermodesulfovibrionales bacterium]|nr:tetratricopeptide repeat protein [Thermodesulfovibrionales bacterium]
MSDKVPPKSSTSKAIKKLIGKIVKAEAKLKTSIGTKDRKQLLRELKDLKASLAWQYLEAEEFVKAKEIYDKLPMSTHATDIYSGKARILIETKKYDEARKLLEESLVKFPDYVPLLNTLGILYNTTGDFYEALRYFDRALAIEPKNNPWSLQNKSGTLTALGYHEEAHKILLNLLRSDPKNSNYNADLAYCEGQRGNYLKAIEYCKKARKNGYETAALYTWMCKAYHVLDQPRKMLAAAREGIRKFPGQNAELYTFLGMGYMTLERYEEARKVLEQGLAVDPKAVGIPELLEVIKTGSHMQKKAGRRIGRPK